MFQSFIRALKLGYGLSIGSKFVQWILESLKFDKTDWGATGFGDKNCPTIKVDLFELEIWRLAMFFPLIISIMLMLRANLHQWPKMGLSSFSAFLISTLTRSIFSAVGILFYLLEKLLKKNWYRMYQLLWRHLF